MENDMIFSMGTDGRLYRDIHVAKCVHLYPVYSINRARLRYRHVSFQPSAAPCRNLIFSGTCLSQGDSGLPLRGNRNDRSGVGMCCALAIG